MISLLYRVISAFLLLFGSCTLSAQQADQSNVVMHEDSRLLLLRKNSSNDLSNSAASLEKNNPKIDNGYPSRPINNPELEALKIKPKAKKQPASDDKDFPIKKKGVTGSAAAPAHNTSRSATAMGFRVQLYNGPDRKKAEAIKTGFSKQYPHVPANIIYVQPGYRVKVGNYKNRIDAEAMLKKLRTKNSLVMIVPDNISP